MKPLDTFYDECIGSKIRQCDLRSSHVLAKTPCTRRRAEINRAQAAFYEDHREQLVKKMLSSNLGKDLAKINAFLANAFLDLFPGSISSIEIEEDYLALLYEEDEYARHDESKGNMTERMNNRHRQIIESEDNQYFYELPWDCGALIDEED